MKILKPTTPEQVRQMGDEIFQAIASVCKEYNEQVLNPVKEKQDDIQHWRRRTDFSLP